MKQIVLSMMFLWGAVAAATAQISQVAQMPYTMSFEASGTDSTELATAGLWNFNVGADAASCADQWKIGKTVRSNGRRSLYVVEDTVHLAGDTTLQNPCYGEMPTLQFVYRDFIFPDNGSANGYIMSFDWMNPSTTSDAALYVGYVAFRGTTPPAADKATPLIAANALTGTFPSGLNANCSGALYNASTWQTYTFPTSKRMYGSPVGNTVTYRVFIAWANRGDVSNRAYGAAIDNIQIVDKRCAAPTNVHVVSIGCDTLQVTWEGNAQDYEVQYRRDGASRWSVASYNHQVSPKQCVIDNLSEGIYQVRVCGKYLLGAGSTTYTKGAFTATADEPIVYCEANHCIAYANLDNANVVCTVNRSEHTFGGWPQDKDYAFDTIMKVDFGSQDMRSRHTVNWDRNAMDPRTENMLNVVPKGYISSVRLGNWNTGAESEGITYTIVPDSSQSILLLKYACVLELPDGHDDVDQPRLYLEILDENGNHIDGDCGMRNFTGNASEFDSTWHKVGSGYDLVLWKEWTTVGLNLTPYVGQTIQVRLATYDCAYSGHYGYTYFVLDCARASIESTSCGERHNFEATAPAGFTYWWYSVDAAGDTLTIAREQEAYIESQVSNTYYCRLSATDAGSTDCWFELDITTHPRFPKPEFTYSYEPQNCENRVIFADQSYYETVTPAGRIAHHDQRMAMQEWDFGDGSEINVMPNCTHVFPQEGGTFDVKYRVWLDADDIDCYDSITVQVTMPKLGDEYNFDTIRICNGTSYLWEKGDGKYHDKAGTYGFRHENEAGCSIFDTLTLTMAPTYHNEGDTTLCFDEALYSGGILYTANAEGVAQKRFTTADCGCDSTVTFYVKQQPELTSNILVDQMKDIFDTATIHVFAENYEYYTLNDDTTHRVDSLINTQEWGDYRFHFYLTDPKGQPCEIEQTVEVVRPCRYKVYQRWDDLLSLYNTDPVKNPENYQYGVDTTEVASYQWFRDSVAIEGANKSYYYAPEKLVLGANYTCVVYLRNGDFFESCPCEVEAYEPAPVKQPISVAPTMLNGTEALHINVPDEGTCYVHNAMGVKLTEAALSEGANDVRFGLPAGAYVLTVHTIDGDQPFRLLVK